MDDAFVTLNRVNKTFEDFKAARDVSFSVKKKSLCALLGPSGSGKTTILRMIAGLETPDSGEITIDGRRVNETPPARRGIGFLFQNYALFGHMTVFDNIAFGLQVKKQSPRRIAERVDELLTLVDLNGLQKRFPHELSGGQRQRVAFARALAPAPDLLLLDEPFAAVDAKVRTELRRWLREMIYRVGITGIFVTHDQDEAVEVADTIIVTNEGRIEQTGTADEIYKRPASAFVAGFIGRSERVSDVGSLRGFEQLSGEAIIRPEYAEAFKSDNHRFDDVIEFADPGIVRDVRFCGNCHELWLDVGENRIVVRRSLERRPVTIGEQMHVIIYRVLAEEADGVKMVENSLLKGKKNSVSLYNW